VLPNEKRSSLSEVPMSTGSTDADCELAVPNIVLFGAGVDQVFRVPADYFAHKQQ
jgi:hypothetical protein